VTIDIAEFRYTRGISLAFHTNPELLMFTRPPGGEMTSTIVDHAQTLHRVATNTDQENITEDLTVTLSSSFEVTN
jgi:hypothetical protein